MIRLSQARTKEWLAIHGWSGMLLGLLLYAVICTGTVAVFATEIGRWSSPLEQPASEGLQPGLNARVQELFERTNPEWREDMDLFAMHGGRLFLRFMGERDVEGGPEGAHEHYGVEYQLDPGSLSILQQTEGTHADFEARRTAGALSEFFVDLHVRLHIPNPWGIFITGVLGLAMMVASITGFVVHRHLIREMFTLRRRKNSLKTARDVHVLAGTWNLPFAFVLAFTGSFFSFASAVGLPAMAMVVFEGDQERALEEVFGAPPAHDDTPAPLANLDTILRDATDRAGVAPVFLSIHFPGRADASVRAFLPPAEGELSGRALDYSGASGAFLRENPVLVGTEPSLGNDVAALMTPLHFGHFAGLLSKSVWFAMGFAGAYVTFSGMLLWTRRRQESLAWRRMAATTRWVGYGLPLAMIFTAWGFFLGGGAQSSSVFAAQWWAFAGSALLAAIVMLLSGQQSRRVLLRLSAFGLAGLPLLRWLSGGPGWGEAFASGHSLIVGMDWVLIGAAALCLNWSRKSLPATEDSSATLAPEPA
ncbi:MAG: PepSY domain-containing protein [Oceanococcaceae bacterium]